MPPKLCDAVTSLAGIGERKAAGYRRLGVATVEQLLMHLPRDYIDLTCVRAPEEWEPDTAQPIRATVVEKLPEQRVRKGLSVFRIIAEAQGVKLQLTFFNTRYTVEAIKPGREYLFYGKIRKTLLRSEMTAPDVIPFAFEGKLMPVYPSTRGLGSRTIAQDIARALRALPGQLPERLPESVRLENGLTDLDTAIRALHAPQSWEQCKAARRRVAFEQMLIYAAAMMTVRGVRERENVLPMRPHSLEPFWRSLPFQPTGDQTRAVKDILSDLTSGRVMNRMLQGDVGSGKTLVAAAAACFSSLNGFQTALMAPTELLADQHARTLSRLFTPLGLKVCLFTGSMGAAARRSASAALESGEAAVAVGTHALLFDAAKFHRLGLVVTDEQHRFGVAQRAALAAKGEKVHTLVMSATPIPRTLSLVLYGDLDISLIRELPPGRTPVKTYRIDSAKRLRAFGFIRDRLSEGRQAYVVCPVVEEGEQTEGLVSAVEYADRLSKDAFSDFHVGLLHGRMKSGDKEDVMRRFVQGEIQLLVSTTVVEVGVDVPNACVMLVENAERFGLSQLHQLRGRVGRGEHPSFCILVSDGKGQAVERLKVLCGTGDGFQIAEEDLRLRGPGDLLGLRQHGMPELSAGFFSDASLLEEAQRAAASLLRNDPALACEPNAALAESVRALIHQVGARPN